MRKKSQREREFQLCEFQLQDVVWIAADEASKLKGENEWLSKGEEEPTICIYTVYTVRHHLRKEGKKRGEGEEKESAKFEPPNLETSMC